MEERLQQLERIVQQLQRDNDDLTNKYNQLQRDYNELKQRVDRIEGGNVNENNNNPNINEKIEEVKINQEGLEQTSQLHEDELVKHGEEIDKINEDQKTTQNRVETNENKINNLGKELKETNTTTQIIELNQMFQNQMYQQQYQMLYYQQQNMKMTIQRTVENMNIAVNNKKKLIFVIEDSDGNKFGVYIDTIVSGQLFDSTKTNEKSFVFSLKNRNNRIEPQKFKLKEFKKPVQFGQIVNNNDLIVSISFINNTFLIGFNINQNTSIMNQNNGHIDFGKLKETNDILRPNGPFTVKRVCVIQIEDCSLEPIEIRIEIIKPQRQKL